MDDGLGIRNNSWADSHDYIAEFWDSPQGEPWLRHSSGTYLYPYAVDTPCFMAMFTVLVKVKNGTTNLDRYAHVWTTLCEVDRW